ncbi:MAG: hypothetical protein ABIG08_01665 [bacterium]
MHPQNRQQQVPCPLCDWEKGRQFTVCGRCHKRYLNEAAQIALQGKPVPEKSEWAKIEIVAKLPELQEAAQAAQAALEERRSQANQKLEELLKEKVGQQYDRLPLAVAETAKQQLKLEHGDAIWQEVKGGTAYGAFQTSSARLAEAERLLGDLEKKENEPSAITDEEYRALVEETRPS